jgi:hypothetical protein
LEKDHNKPLGSNGFIKAWVVLIVNIPWEKNI